MIKIIIFFSWFLQLWWWRGIIQNRKWKNKKALSLKNTPVIYDLDCHTEIFLFRREEIILRSTKNFFLIFENYVFFVTKISFFIECHKGTSLPFLWRNNFQNNISIFRYICLSVRGKMDKRNNHVNAITVLFSIIFNLFFSEKSGNWNFLTKNGN